MLSPVLLGASRWVGGHEQHRAPGEGREVFQAGPASTEKRDPLGASPGGQHFAPSSSEMQVCLCNEKESLLPPGALQKLMDITAVTTRIECKPACGAALLQC